MISNDCNVKSCVFNFFLNIIFSANAMEKRSELKGKLSQTETTLDI